MPILLLGIRNQLNTWKGEIHKVLHSFALFQQRFLILDFAVFHRMFEYAVSFDQDLSGWSVANVENMVNMFEGATGFDQSLCWSDIQQDVLAAGMFCESHPGAHFDPCCVTSESVIVEACCGGSCDTFCPPVTNYTKAPVSNDPPSPTEDDSVLEDPVGDDSFDVSTPNTTESDGSENEVVGLPGDAEDNEEDEGNLWQREVWLRVAVYIAILMLLACIFLFFLHRRRSATDGASTEAADTVQELAGADDPQKDTEIGIVTTNLTELTDAMDDVKPPAEPQEAAIEEAVEEKNANTAEENAAIKAEEVPKEEKEAAKTD